MDAFPAAASEEYSNGMISMKLNMKNHLSKGLNQPLTFLVGFRQFVQYHIQSMIVQLHTNMRKRVTAFERVITEAKRDKDMPRNWRENFGGVDEADRELEEEEKVEEVYVHNKMSGM